MKTITDLDNKIIEVSIEKNLPVLLVGETGTGKTTMINYFAKEHKKELHRISLNGTTSIEEIIGRKTLENGNIVWQDGLLLDAMKKGDWVVFDEINSALPDILFCLHSLLDDDRKVTVVENKNEVIKPHKNFRFFATMNPSEEYAGTKEMNTALLSRFNAILNIEPADLHTEIEILKSKGIDDDVSEKLVKLARRFREIKNDEQIMYFCSTRDIIQAGLIVSKDISVTEAINFSILNKMSSEDKKYVAELNIVDIMEADTKEQKEIKKLEAHIEELKQKKHEAEQGSIRESSLNKKLTEEIEKLKKETSSTSPKKEKEYEEKIDRLEKLLIEKVNQVNNLIKSNSNE